MSAGDITKGIISEIRETLRIYGTENLIKTNELLYSSLNKYQRKWMKRHRTTIAYYDITLDSAETDYELSPRVFEIRKIKNGADNAVTDYAGTYDARTHSLIISNTDITTGDTLIVSAFIMPVETEITYGGSKILDEISDTVDPIIVTGDLVSGNDFKDLLVEAVCAEYDKKNTRKLFEIEKDVCKTAMNGWSRMRAADNSNYQQRIKL